MKRLLIVLSLNLTSLVAFSAPPPPPGSNNATPIDEPILVMLVLGVALGVWAFKKLGYKQTT